MPARILICYVIRRFVHAICLVLYLLHVAFAELSLLWAWNGHEFYGHAIQYVYMADSVFSSVFVGFAI